MLSQAKTIGLQDKLLAVSSQLGDQPVLGSTEAETKRQIDFLIGQLSTADNLEVRQPDAAADDSATGGGAATESDDGYQEEDGNDDDDEEDPLEDEDVDIEREVDLEDPVVAREGEMFGNQLLEAKYCFDDNKGTY